MLLQITSLRKFYGLYLIKGQQSSVFLPQVPVEQGWDLTTYLEQLCYKAGVSGNAWKDKDTRLFIFSRTSSSRHGLPRSFLTKGRFAGIRAGIPF